MTEQSRRKFLKLAAQGVGYGGYVGLASMSGLVASCASFDRLILGEGVEDPKRVVVIGAGLAGLSACYDLKKAGVPFLLFEASPRLGGRVYSLSDFNSAAQIGELGGEWIWPGQELIFQVARELRLELNEKKLSANQIYWNDIDRKSFQIDYKRFDAELQKIKLDIFGRAYLRLTPSNADELKKAVDLDQTNCIEFMQSLKVPNELKTTVLRVLESHFGLPAKKLSSLQLIYFFTQAQSPLHPTAQQAWRFSLGSGALAQALYDRVAGVIPGRSVKFQHQLVEVDKQDSLYEMKFQTPTGVQTFMASRVISTIPLHLMRQVPGFYKLGFEENVVKAVSNFESGDLSKAVLSYADRPWSKNQSCDRGLLPKGAQFWETEPRGATSLSMTPKSILSLQWGGEAAVKAGLHSVDEAYRELTAAKMSSGYEQKSQLMNWSRAKWTQGGRTVPSLGGHRWVGGLMSTPDSNWILAGDFASVVWTGTMNGAVESGLLAAQKIRAKRAAST